MISIITPTYNRMENLKDLFESLKNQTCFDFEWIIVDDGSLDDTNNLIQGWLDEKDINFDINYYYQNNSGKHVAVNLAVKKALYDHVFIVDSDDTLTEDSVSTIHEWIFQSKDNLKLAGVSGLIGYKKGDIVGQFPQLKEGENYIECSNLSRRENKLGGDKAEVYKTDILKKFPFPVFKNEKFITERVVWDRIADAGYEIRWYNKIIYLCEYLEGGLSDNMMTLQLENFKGHTLNAKQAIKLLSPLEGLSIAGNYVLTAKKIDINIKEASTNLDKNILYLYFAMVAVKARQYLR